MTYEVQASRGEALRIIGDEMAEGFECIPPNILDALEHYLRLFIGQVEGSSFALVPDLLVAAWL
jgi:hypothetical protein